MSTKLSDFLPDRNATVRSTRITPSPDAWKTQTQSQTRYDHFTAQTKDVSEILPYDIVSGLSLCFAGIDKCVRKYPGFDPNTIYISSLLLPDFERDFLARFHRPYDPASPFIPYPFGLSGASKWIRIEIDNAIEKNTVFVSE